MSSIFKNKKLFTAIITMIMVALLAIPASAEEAKFTDVSSTYHDAVDFLVANGISEGYSSTTFGTTDTIKRMDAAVFIARSLGLDKDGDYADSGFKDVPTRAKWAVDVLHELGIIDGMNATTFGSDAPLTRNQTAKIIANAAELKIDDVVTKTVFEDVNKNFAKYVDALVKSGITKGKSAKNFGAYDSVTRGEFALFLSRGKEHFGYFELMVMHINDSHAYLDKFPYITTAVKETRANNKNNIFLHAGDVFSGDLYFNAFHGEADLKLMNYMGFDAMVFGNHEFDLGSTNDGHKALSEFVKGAKFPFVAANVDFSKDNLFNGLQSKTVTDEYEDGKIYNGVVLEVNGEKVGVFGLTTEETPTISSTKEVAFSNYIEEAKAAVKQFEELGINKIIALTHLGFDDSLLFDNDKELAKEVEGIDIIVGGHTHSKLAGPYVSKKFDAPTIIVTANEYGKFLGTLNVVFNEHGEITNFNGKLLNTDHTAGSTYAADPGAATILKPYADEVKVIKEKSTGVEALVDLNGSRDSDNSGTTSVRHSETNLGNLITDGMLAKAKTINPATVIALQNGGGIRASIEAGDITVGDVLKVLSFGNALAIVELTGEEITAALEHSVSADPREKGGLKENGAFLHVSGLKFTYDSSKPKGERVQSVEVLSKDGYKPIVTTEKYVVATNTFTARGGDGYTMLGKAYDDGRVSEPGNIDYQTFIDHITSLDEVNPEVEGRIVDLALTK